MDKEATPHHHDGIYSFSYIVRVKSSANNRDKAKRTADKFLMLALSRVFKQDMQVVRIETDGPNMHLQFDPKAYDAEHEGHDMDVIETPSRLWRRNPQRSISAAESGLGPIKHDVSGKREPQRGFLKGVPEPSARALVRQRQAMRSTASQKNKEM